MRDTWSRGEVDVPFHSCRGEDPGEIGLRSASPLSGVSLDTDTLPHL